MFDISVTINIIFSIFIVIKIENINAEPMLSNVDLLHLNNMDTHSFIQGSFTKDNVIVEVLGMGNKYRYRWVKQLDEQTKSVDYSQTLPVLIIDYSGSMQYSKSAVPATNATKNILAQLFDKGMNEALVVFFGQTAYDFVVNRNNYKILIDEVLQGYFDDVDAYDIHGKFKINATIPTLAFNSVHNYISKSNHTNAFIVFMTDGGFNGKTNAEYLSEWDSLSKKFALTKKQLSISCIGYMNDQLANIKQMKECFDKTVIPLSYITIKQSNEIQNAMEEASGQFESVSVPKIQLTDDTLLVQNESVYLTEKLFETLDPVTVVESATKNTGVSEDWIQRVILLEIDIGLMETSVTTTLNSISKSSNSKPVSYGLYGMTYPSNTNSKLQQEYLEVFNKMVSYFALLQKKYLELRGEYKSLKTRDIGAWKSLLFKIENFGTLFRDVQSLVSENLNEKKSFELATKISNSVTSRHLRTLQRRKVANELNQKKKETTISLENQNPVTVKCTFSDKDDSKMLSETLTSGLEELNDYYTCSYSLEEWSDLLNTCLGISMQYVWKEGDDWSPSRAFIENVSTSSFVSIDGYNEMQTIFGATATPDHQKLYGSNKYVASAHDKGNAFIPVAVDPFFVHKLPMIKERLGHMIAGSSLAFRNSHVLFYVSVIRQCFNQLLENNTGKMRHILMLLLNTFKLLTNKLNTVFDKEQSPVNKSDILFNIAIGNTASYLFNGSWESAIFTLTSTNQQFESAHQKFMKDKNIELSMSDFKKRIWEMVLRHWLIASHNNRVSWESPETWGLLDGKIIEEKLKIEGTEALTKYLMNDAKVMDIPDKIQTDLTELRNTKLMKLFKLLVCWSENLNDATWSQFNKSFIPINVSQDVGELTNYFTDEILDKYNYWCYWECFSYGHKDCYPMRSIEEISKVVANNINGKYGENLTGVLADVKELIDFRKRAYETRYLPVTFTIHQQDTVNELFGKVYSRQIKIDEFKNVMKQCFGGYYAKIFDEVLETDKIDVLENLFQYCQKYKHSIWIKHESKLPHSCPGNPSSPIFLQQLTDSEFSQYFKPLGFGWSTKKYRDWVDDLHPFMFSQLSNCSSKDTFVHVVMDHVKMYHHTRERDIEIYATEAKHFYDQFKY